MNSPTSVDILRRLIDRDSRALIELPFDEHIDWADADGRQVDEALRDALDDGLLAGERAEGDGSISWWSTTRLTVGGLRTLGEWPPPGRERDRGLWDDGYWGKRVRPLLQRLVADPPYADCYLKPLGEPGEDWLDWTATLLLLEAGLISGTVQDDCLADLRIRDAGRNALDPSPRDPLEVAEAKLRAGARVDAIVTAVEYALVPRLRDLAEARGVLTRQDDGQPVKAATLNIDLRKAGAYDKAQWAQVDAWLQLRNAVAHGQDARVTDGRVATMLTGVGVFVDEHPA
jgi:hypothetical protein